MAVDSGARYIVKKAPGVGGNRIPDHEPCIIIRGQDVLAMAIMDIYIAMYDSLAAEHRDDKVLRELVDHRYRLQQWRQHHPLKWADR